MTTRKIARALLSVSDKAGLVDFARALRRHGVDIVSTGGTARLLREAGIEVIDVAEITGLPEMMDGRVKTLHPKIHGGLLALRENERASQGARRCMRSTPIDLFVANLYPFEQTVAGGADFATCIETIDIGGPAMIRAGAKNHDGVTVVVEPADYAPVIAEMDAHGGATTLALRQSLAAQRLRPHRRLRRGDRHLVRRPARRDDADDAHHRRPAAPRRCAMARTRTKRPPSTAPASRASASPPPRRCRARSSPTTISTTPTRPTSWSPSSIPRPARPCAIIKHANPCGVALGASLWPRPTRKALACDPVSAFGGIVALNRPLDADAAREIVKIFTEVIIAPDASDEAKAILAEKKNLRLLLAGGLPDPKAPGPDLPLARRRLPRADRATTACRPPTSRS